MKRSNEIRAIVGTKNPTKIKAVQKVMRMFFRNARVVPKPAASDIPEQPRSLGETVRGAKNRAKNAWNATRAVRTVAQSKRTRDQPTHEYAIGLESGWMKIPRHAGTFDVAACAIYDGKKFSVGLSPAFVIPPAIVDYVKKHDGHMSGAFEHVFPEAGKNLGERTGAIGFLTRKKYVRQNLNEHALLMALVPRLNATRFA